MRSKAGTREPVDKFIQAINERMDFDLIYDYVREIARYYTSEYKTKDDILNTFEGDIKSLVFAYGICYQASGHDEEYNRLIGRYGLESKPNKAAEIAMRNISLGLEFLINEAAINKVFFKSEKLKELGLPTIPKAIRFTDYVKDAKPINSLYDSAVNLYKVHVCEKPVPPLEVLSCFENQTFFEKFYNESKGCIPEDIAINYYNLPMSMEFLRNFKRFKAFYDYFINPADNMPSYNDFKQCGKVIGERQFKNIMKKAKERILGV